MNNADEFEKIPEKMQDSEKIKEAFHLLERMRWTEKELDEYLAEADAAGYMDRVLEGAKELAIKQGIEQGAQKKAETIVINALKKGLDLEIIALITGFTIEEIKNLQNKNV